MSYRDRVFRNAMFAEVALECVGVFGGWIVNRRFVNFDAKIGTVKEKIVRFLIGAMILGIISTQTTHLIDGEGALKYLVTVISFSSGFFTMAIYPAMVVFVRKKILKK